MASLSDQLKALGVRLGAKELSEPTKPPSVPLEKIIEGTYCENPFGHIYCVDKIFSSNYRQGVIELIPFPFSQTLTRWINDSRWLDIHPSKVIFIDIETSGLHHSSGTFAFLIGIGRFVQTGFHLTQIFMDDPSQEQALLIHLSSLTEDYHGLVSFNGKSFDIPLLSSRYALIGEKTNLGEMPHFDLLPLARRLWRNSLSSKSLHSLEINVLKFIRTSEDVPGWYVPELYREFLILKDARPLKGVFYHNAMDILSMAAVYSCISGILYAPKSNTIQHRVDLASLAKLYEDLMDFETAIRLYASNISDVPDEQRKEILLRWSLLEKRRRNYSQAVALWKWAAQSDDISAMVELAKFYEHTQKDYEEAIRWVEIAMDAINNCKSYVINQQELKLALAHRCSRLRHKLSKHRSIV